MKGVENMKKSTWIFVIGLVFLALTLNAVGQTGAVAVSAEAGTTSMQALKAGYVNSSGDDGLVWTGIVLSNTLGGPDVEGLPGGGDTEGTVMLTCYKDDTGEVVTAETPVLGPGESAIFVFRELIENTDDWKGYCYAISNFDALSGLVIVGSSEGFGWYGYQMTTDFAGVSVGPVM